VAGDALYLDRRRAPVRNRRQQLTTVDRATIRNISRAVRFVGRSSDAKSIESNGTFGAPWQNEHVTPRPLATT
jgi:hypothetical protein